MRMQSNKRLKPLPLVVDEIRKKEAKACKHRAAASRAIANQAKERHYQKEKKR